MQNCGERGVMLRGSVKVCDGSNLINVETFLERATSPVISKLEKAFANRDNRAPLYFDSQTFRSVGSVGRET